MAIYSINGGAASPVAGAIRDAARSTGTSFEYLLTTAQIESNLNPAAQATTSSAKGHYQFIEQTWLATMKQAGPSLGYARYAGAIVQMPDGQYAVSDPAARVAIMRLRGDSSVMRRVDGRRLLRRRKTPPGWRRPMPRRAISRRCLTVGRCSRPCSPTACMAGCRRPSTRFGARPGRSRRASPRACLMNW